MGQDAICPLLMRIPHAQHHPINWDFLLLVAQGADHDRVPYGDEVEVRYDLL